MPRSNAVNSLIKFYSNRRKSQIKTLSEYISRNIRKAGISNYRPQMLSAGVCLYIPKDLPNGHKNIRSHREEGNKWLLSVLEIAQNNLATFHHFHITTVLMSQSAFVVSFFPGIFVHKIT